MKTTGQQIFLTAGVNLNLDARVLRPGQLALSKNAFPVKAGVLGKRNGFVGSRIAVRTDIQATPTHSYFPLSWGLAPSNCGYRFVTKFHKYAYTGFPPLSALAATALDKETATFAKGIVQTLDWQSEYEPTTFVNYRGTCIALVPGMEGFYVLSPKLTGDGYEWVKASFLFDPAAVAIQNSQIIPVTPYRACQYKRRMVYGNFGPGKGNWIIFADKATSSILPSYATPLSAIVGTDVLALNGRHVEVGSIEGEDILAMQEVTLTAMGSQIDTVMMLLTARSCVFISGEILQTTDTGATDPNGLFGTYKENRINFECGCVSQAALAKTPYGWAWASNDDVWLLKDNIPFRIGTNIRPALRDCPTNLKKYWSMAYANGILVLQLVTSSTQTAANQDASGYTTAYIHQYWYLDMRAHAPTNADEAEWYGPMEVAAEDGVQPFMGPLLTTTDSDGKQHINILATYIGNNQNDTYLCDVLPDTNEGYDALQVGVKTAGPWAASTRYEAGDVVLPTVQSGNEGKTGRMHVAYNVSGDQLTGGSEPAWATTNGGLTVDNHVTWQEINGDSGAIGVYLAAKESQEIQVDIRARDSLLDDPIREKLLRHVDVNVAAEKQVNINTSAIIDQGATVGDLGTNTFGNEALQADFGTVGSGIGGPKSTARAFRPDESTLVQGRQMQIKIQDKTSYIIDDSNDYFNIASFKDDGAPDIRLLCLLQVQLTHGEYATLDALISHITTRLNLYKSTFASNSGGSGFFLFNYNTAYGVTFPYFTQMTLSYTGIGNAQIFSPIHDVSAGTLTSGQGPIFIGDETSTLYADRSKRVWGLLGYDCGMSSAQYYAGNVAMPGITFGSNYYSFTWIGVTASPININGSQIVNSKNSAHFDVAALYAAAQVKTAIPFKNKARS